MLNKPFKLWVANLDYLVCRASVTYDPLTQLPLSDLMITELVKDHLRLNGIPAVKHRWGSRGFRLDTTDVDLHIFKTGGIWCIDFFCNVDALYLRPGPLWQRVVLLHGLASATPGLHVGLLHAQEMHPSVTFSGGQIGRRSILRIESKKKPWPKLNPYKRGECVLYGKSAELTQPNMLHKRYVVGLCKTVGYDEDEHGELYRLEFRVKAKRLTQLGYPDLPLMWQNLMDEYPLMRGGGMQEKRVDPQWKRLRMAWHRGAWHEAPDVWAPTPNLEAEQNQARSLLVWAAGVLLADHPEACQDGREAMRHIASRYFPHGSGAERDLLDRIGIERQTYVTVGPHGQQLLAFEDDEAQAKSA